jgi:hypothetical protein
MPRGDEEELAKATKANQEPPPAMAPQPSKIQSLHKGHENPDGDLSEVSSRYVAQLPGTASPSAAKESAQAGTIRAKVTNSS